MRPDPVRRPWVVWLYALLLMVVAFNSSMVASAYNPEFWIVAYGASAVSALMFRFRPDLRHLRVAVAAFIATSFTRIAVFYFFFSTSAYNVFAQHTLTALLAYGLYSSMRDSGRYRERLPGWW